MVQNGGILEKSEFGWWLEEYEAVGGRAGRGGRLLLEDDTFHLWLFLLGPLSLEDEITDSVLSLLKFIIFQCESGL